MPIDDELDRFAHALERADEEQRRSQRAIQALHAQLDALIKLLVARDVLNAGHGRHLDVVARQGGRGEAPKVRLRQYIDKYNMVHGEFVDCADRIPICKARCCRFRVDLTVQDIEEGKVRWDIENPYVLLRDPDDGRCIYQDRATGFCGNYEHRPALCRQYSCKNDPRIWLDFDKKIPAPAPLRSDPEGSEMSQQ